MSRIYSVELLYETLVPVNYLSVRPYVSAVSLLADTELHLEFCTTSIQAYRHEDSHSDIFAIAYNFDHEAFDQKYQMEGLSSESLTYEFFAAKMADTYITKVSTQYLIKTFDEPVPLTLKACQLYFRDGRRLDYSDRISVFALADLAEVA